MMDRVRPRPHAAVVAVVVTLFAGSLGAQPRHPIYVQYDGFVRADDNRLVLSFGYHNLNQVDVTIGVGDENRFLADPEVAAGLLERAGESISASDAEDAAYANASAP